ncbi:MAG: MinD/ParA family protein [bacterium]
MTRDGGRPEPVVYAVASGKGGVGKTNVVLNLAMALAETQTQVLVLDADLGLANVDVLLGVRPAYTLADVLRERCSLEQALMEGPNGIRMLPADSGQVEYTGLRAAEMVRIFALVQHLRETAHAILIDTASGISSNVRFFSSFAHQVLLIATPEPTSITDAYATMKVLSRSNGERHFRLIINMVDSDEQGREIYRTLSTAAEHFLGIRTDYAGCIRKDRNMERAVRRQTPILLLAPDSPASRDIRLMARKLLRDPAGPRPAGGGGTRPGVGFEVPIAR